MSCFCGCGRRAGHDHHVIYQQELRWIARRLDGTQRWRGCFRQLAKDRRNIVRVSNDCHRAHHAGVQERDRYELRLLPDSVFEFAEEKMGAGPAYEYLRRHYRGDDPRLERLLVAADVKRVTGLS